jgi:hypothetical protein
MLADAIFAATFYRLLPCPDKESYIISFISDVSRFTMLICIGVTQNS